MTFVRLVPTAEQSPQLLLGEQMALQTHLLYINAGVCMYYVLVYEMHSAAIIYVCS